MIQLGGQPWNLVLLDYPPPPGDLHAAPSWLCHTESLPSCCFSSYRQINMVTTCSTMMAFFITQLQHMAPQKWVHKISSPRMNSLEILTMNTQLISGHHPKVNSTNASFKTGMVSPDIIHRTYDPVSSLSGSPAVLLGVSLSAVSPKMPDAPTPPAYGSPSPAALGPWQLWFQGYCSACHEQPCWQPGCLLHSL
jgi:hypothetical protein